MESRSRFQKLTKGVLGTQASISRRGKKGMAHLNDVLSFSKYSHTWSLTRSSADFKPAATELRLVMRHRREQYFHPACPGSVTSSKTATQASPKQVPGGLQLSALRSDVWAFSLPRFLLAAAAALPNSPLFPPDPRQLLGVQMCNLLFGCCWLVSGHWLVPSRWLLNL